MSSSSHGPDWLVWLAHLVLGNVTSGSWERFVAWLNEHPLDQRSQSTWNYLAHYISPIASLVSDDWDVSDFGDLVSTAVSFGGINGLELWIENLGLLRQKLASLLDPERRRLGNYGPAVLANETRKLAESALDMQFDPRMQPIALEWLNEPRHEPRLSEEEFDRLSEWFGSLPPNNPWRRRSIGYRAARHAVTLGRVGSSSAKAFIDVLDDYMVASIAAQVAALDDYNEEDLRVLLSHPSLQQPTYRVR